MGSSRSARRSLERSWYAGDYAECSAILAETFPEGGTASQDAEALADVVRALRPMSAAEPATAAAALEPFRARRADLFRVAAASNNDLRIALESDAIATHDTGPGWATAFYNYIILRARTIGARREQIWEGVALIHWGAGHLFQHCDLGEVAVAELMLAVLNADMHLNWECGAPTILKLVMQEDRTKLQDGLVARLTHLANTGQLTEPEAFLTFDIDGRLATLLTPAIAPHGIRHPNSVALHYFNAHNGTLPAADFLAGIATVPCMVIGDRCCFIVAGDFMPGFGRSLNQVSHDAPRSIRLTWWLNVNFPREQLGNPGFILSRVPLFVRALLKHGKATLVLAATGEASWFSPRWVDWMDGLAATLDCRPDQLVYLCQNTRFPDDYRMHCADHGLRSRVGVIPMNGHLMLGGLRDEPLPAAPTRRFLCFNQRPHLHRAALLLSLDRDGLLADTHMSFNQSLTGEVPLSGQVLAPWMNEPATTVDARLDAMEARLPLRLDLSGQGVATAVDAGYVDHFSAALFADAAVYLVTESDMDGPTMSRFTEKTVKGLAAEIPFIVFGNAGVLASLRELGFRSFAPLIDEAYDTVADPVQRFRMAYAEVKRLAAMPFESLVGLRQVLQPVLQHNRRRLLAIGPVLEQRLAEALEKIAAANG